MKKLLIVKIIQTVDTNKKQISLVATEINCSSSDEIHIKRSIEYTRDPNVLTAIFTQNMSKAVVVEMKEDLDDMRKNITKADAIEAGFLPLGDCDSACETCILHDLQEKLGKMFLGTQSLPPSCLN